MVIVGHAPSVRRAWRCGNFRCRNGNAGRVARVAVIALWLGANLALGWCAVLPVVTGWLLWDYVSALTWATHAAPFHSDDAQASVLIVLVGLAFVAGGFLVANLPLRRRLPRWPGAAFWPATAVVLVLPLGRFVLLTDHSARAMLW
jgi:hypothetical protein